MVENIERLCVTGGSGFIGTNAVARAISSNIPVLNIDVRPPKVKEHKFCWKNVDILQSKSLREALCDFQPTHILHLAAKTGMDAPDIEYFSANTTGVKNLIDATSKVTSVKRTLFASSLLVCRNGYIPSSDTDYCPINFYGESKVIGEQIVRQHAASDGWVIVRPTSVWGPWFEHSYKTFFQIIAKRLYIHPGNKEVTKPLSYVANAVYSMEALLSECPAKVCGQTFYLADYPQISTKLWANEIAKTLGHGNPIHVPLPFLRSLAIFGDIAKSIFKYEAPLTTFRLNNMLTGAEYPYQKTENIVGELPISLQNAIAETLNWMQQQELISPKLEVRISEKTD